MHFIICLPRQKVAASKTVPGTSVDITVLLKFCLILSNSAVDSKSSTVVGDVIVEKSRMGGSEVYLIYSRLAKVALPRVNNVLLAAVMQ